MSQQNRYFEVTFEDGTKLKQGYDLKTNPTNESLKEKLELDNSKKIVKMEEIDAAVPAGTSKAHDV